jgi:hypothetical protein
MHDSFNKFNKNIERVKILGGFYSAICSLTTPALDPSDILRSQIVLVVSAMDAFIHDITRVGMLEISENKRPSTDKYNNFKISILSLSRSFTGATFSECLEDEVRRSHGYLAFQQPGKISDALNFFSSLDLWNSIGRKLGKDAKDLKNELSLIVQRRDKIAHEADSDPSYPNARWPITLPDVNHAINFIELIGTEIYNLVTQANP